MNALKKITIATLFFYLLIGFLCVESLIAQNTAEKLSRKRYVDPKGYFKIVPPEDWRIREYPQDPRGKVTFISTEDSTLRVLTNAVDFTSFRELLNWCRTDGKTKLVNLGAEDFTIEKITFGGSPAVWRTFQLRSRKFLMIDFLIGTIGHNLQFSAPLYKYNQSSPVAMQSIGTYEPTLRNVSERKAIKHVVVKKFRLGQLMIQDGNYELALEFVKEGLEVSPSDPNLLKLKQQIENKLKKE